MKYPAGLRAGYAKYKKQRRLPSKTFLRYALSRLRAKWRSLKPADKRRLQEGYDDAFAMMRDLIKMRRKRRKSKSKRRNPLTATMRMHRKVRKSRRASRARPSRKYRRNPCLPCALALVGNPPKRRRKSRNSSACPFKYKGYRCTCLGAGYNCPELKLYGYSTDLTLARAIDRELKKRKR